MISLVTLERVYPYQLIKVFLPRGRAARCAVHIHIFETGQQRRFRLLALVCFVLAEEILHFVCIKALERNHANTTLTLFILVAYVYLWLVCCHLLCIDVDGIY